MGQAGQDELAEPSLLKTLAFLICPYWFKFTMQT